MPTPGTMPWMLTIPHSLAPPRTRFILRRMRTQGRHSQVLLLIRPFRILPRLLAFQHSILPRRTLLTRPILPLRSTRPDLPIPEIDTLAWRPLLLCRLAAMDKLDRKLPT